MFYENNTKAVSSNKIFLLEVIVSIFFFVVFATVTTRVFFVAHNNNQKSIAVNKSMLLCQNVAESFIEADGNIEKITSEFSFEKEGETLVLKLNKAFETAKKDDCKYVAVLKTNEEKTESGIVKNAEMKIFEEKSKDSDGIYSLNFNTYVPSNLTFD